MIITIPIFLFLLFVVIYAFYCFFYKEDSFAIVVAIEVLALMLLVTIFPMPSFSPTTYEAEVLSHDTVFCRPLNKTYKVNTLLSNEVKTVKIRVDTWSNWYKSGPMSFVD